MATYNIFHGGQRTQNLDYAMLEQVEPDKDAYMQPDHRSASCRFSPTYTFYGERVRGSTWMAGGSLALAQFFDRLDELGTPIAVGDVLNIMIMPKHTELERITWQVSKPLAGVEFKLDIRGNGLGGALALGASLDGSASDTQMIDVYAKNGNKPAFFDENDMLTLEFSAIPAEGLRKFGLHVAAGLYEPLMDRA